MERERISMGAASFRRRPTPRTHITGGDAPERTSSKSSLVVGAKTLAGIGIGLLAVSGGALVLGAATEAVIVPSLLLKLAGGLTGGGLGMAKGLKDTTSKT